MKRSVISKEFTRRLLELMNLLGFKDRQRSKFAEQIGVSASFLSDVLNLKSGPSFSLISGISKSFQQVNIQWLLTGNGTPYLTKDVDASTDKSDKPSHSVIISNFKQKELAWQINWDLLKLEGLDPNELFEIQEFINYRLSKLERRESERRKVDDPDAIPGGKERRSNRDRRKTGT